MGNSISKFAGDGVSIHHVSRHRSSRNHAGFKTIIQTATLTCAAFALASCVSSGSGSSFDSANNGNVEPIALSLAEGETSSTNIVPTRAPRSLGDANTAPSVEPTALISEPQNDDPSVVKTAALAGEKAPDGEKTSKPVQVASLNQEIPAAGSATSTTNSAPVSAAEPEQKVTLVEPDENAETENPVETQDQVAAVTPPEAAPVKKKSLFERMFSRTKQKNASTGNKPKVVKSASAPKNPRPKVRVASLNTGSKQSKKARRSGSASGLPGVKRSRSLFGISREDPKEEEAANIQVASAGGFGRLSPNGLRLQHKGVQVHCFKPGLLRMLKVIERRYGKKPVITSGYRSPRANRRAGGARKSYHIRCEAADIQVPGVSKWSLAKYIRSLPGRGGVGTYCRTNSVHIDIGNRRDWHHKCRRSSLKKRRS